jgi:cytidylate kinase
MTASVVALSVQAGSGGFTVAHRVAEQLSFRYYDWEITSEAAARAGVTPNDVLASERVPGFFERVMRRLGAVSAVSIEGGASFAEPSPAMWNTAVQSLDSDEYRPFIEHVVTELADQGDALIVGHAGQYLLRDRPNVLKVLLTGSTEMRADRLAAEQDISVSQAIINVKQSDKDRSDLLRKLYHFSWLDASLYDLSLSTDHLPLETVTDIIAAAVRSYP